VPDAAVVGRPDEEAGELPEAVDVVAEGEPTAEEVVSLVAERVAPQKKVRKVEFVGEISKPPSGKILRRNLTRREGPKSNTWPVVTTDKTTPTPCRFLFGLRGPEPGSTTMPLGEPTAASWDPC
jgi:acyl-CoA synthetase (AMP-forming)/AMP-acid ligase II